METRQEFIPVEINSRRVFPESLRAGEGDHLCRGFKVVQAEFHDVFIRIPEIETGYGTVIGRPVGVNASIPQRLNALNEGSKITMLELHVIEAGILVRRMGKMRQFKNCKRHGVGRR